MSIFPIFTIKNYIKIWTCHSRTHFSISFPLHLNIKPKFLTKCYYQVLFTLMLGTTRASLQSSIPVWNYQLSTYHAASDSSRLCQAALQNCSSLSPSLHSQRPAWHSWCLLLSVCVSFYPAFKMCSVCGSSPLRCYHLELNGHPSPKEAPPPFFCLPSLYYPHSSQRDPFKTHIRSWQQLQINSMALQCTLGFDPNN